MHGLDVTFTRTLSPEDAAEYDLFVDRSHGGAYAQARAWATPATAGRPFAPRWFLARRRGRLVGAALVLRPRLLGRLSLPVGIVERGPVTDSLDDLPEVLTALRVAAITRGIARLQVMPYWADEHADRASQILADGGFQSVQTLSGAHARTLRVDLKGKTEATLFAGKSGETLRRKVRQAEKAGAFARRGTEKDLPELEKLYAELMRGQGRGAKPRAWFDALAPILTEGRRGAVFLCEHEGDVVSALYASCHGRIATFVLGASSGVERSFSKMVPAMVSAIRWALAEGCEAFDMGGIPLEDDTDEKRRSIAQFKLDFAKTPVRLVGEHARWL
ncbi:tRNA-dependent lipid II--amino acid ligase [Labilithrix luteola]|uniref:tRNA-dependent lipid II--amino acid ligase n=1 Tax=Labilithrix luteola TaxID=1391654 RepID=A0A0K1Q7X1_9BACT|nr:GNAT family N-acetyltransferase [Labilithrix luteola]AKV01824.1 tRNA-dependent lipid II--amino acid ligase [Labilithrix luteola]